MDDNAPKENPPADFNKLDLSQLQGFSFGTQWTQEKPAPAERRERDAGDRPRREDRRDGGGAPDRRDRRAFRRPAGPGGSDTEAPPAGAGAGGPERREFSGDRRPRRDGPGGDFRGGPRREFSGDRGPRQGGYGGHGRGAPMDRGPYESPYYAVTFYPEDTSFNTLVQTIRKSCRTVELFEIARTVVAKTDRFVVVVAHKPPGAAEAPARTGARGASEAPKPASPAAADLAAKPKPVFYISVPDGMPFESDEAAIAHVLGKHLDKFFDTAEVEVDPPKGNFQVINKCGVTGELLGPPNYHRYNQIVQQHHAAKIGSRMSLEAFRTRIETLRDPEVVNQWLAKMKKTTRFTWKQPGAKPIAPAALAPPPAESAAPAEDAAPETAPAAEAPVAPPTPIFDTLEDARLHLLTHARDRVVRTAENARFHGKLLESMPPGEIRRAVEGALERQRRFPLDTANALRGRLRREHFTIFKKGSKGISYVCAVKRKFRVPGQTFSDSIGALISFIEANPMIRASELPVKFLSIAHAVPPKPVEPAPAPAAPPPEGGAAGPVAEASKPESTLTLDDRAKISRLQGDLMWLVREGYVTEFIDGRLFAPPPMVEARKKEVESEEHDPENFPEVPANETSPPAAASTTETPPLAETPPAAESPAATAEAPAPETSAAPTVETAPAEEPTPPAEPASESSEPAPSEEKPASS